LTEWLTGIGLEFKPSKTRVTHTLHQHQGHVGFDFLGCTIRQFPVGTTHTGRTTSGQPLGFTTRITPSKEAITRHTADLGEVIRHHRTVSQEELIGLLTPKVRGWHSTIGRWCPGRHVQVRGAASPFDDNVTYWAQRPQQHPQTGATLGQLLATQGGRCARCGLLILALSVLASALPNATGANVSQLVMECSGPHPDATVNVTRPS